MINPIKMVRCKFKTIFFSVMFCILFSGSVYAQKAKNVKNLSCEEFYVKMNQQPEAVLIDVRLVADYQEKRIPGAVLAQKSEMLKKVTDSLEKSIPVLVYCYDGDRSKTACKILTRQLKFTDVYHLKNGMDQWEKMGFPVDTTSLGKNRE